MTEEEARQYVGQYCDIRWPHGGMAGIIVEVKEGWVVVDWGIGADLKDVTSITPFVRDETKLGEEV